MNTLSNENEIGGMEELDAFCHEAIRKSHCDEAVEHLLRAFSKRHPGLVQAFLHSGPDGTQLCLIDLSDEALKTMEASLREASEAESIPWQRPLKKVVIQHTHPEPAADHRHSTLDTHLGQRGLLTLRKELTPAQAAMVRGLEARLHLILFHFIKLRNALSYDHLTGLYNRRYFEEQLDKVLKLVHRHKFHICVAVIDLDRFKQVNDQYGHQAGDEVLRQVASRLYCSLRGTDVIARFGGDEFAALIQYADRNSSEVLAERLARGIGGEPFLIGGKEITLHASIGMSVLGGDDPIPSAAELLKNADQAMFKAKDSWGSSWEIH